MIVHSLERKERQRKLKWNSRTGFGLSSKALAHALCVEDVLEFYTSNKQEEVNTPREAFNWDLRVRALRDVVCKNLCTAPSYLLDSKHDDSRSSVARATAIRCLYQIDRMTYPQIELFATPYLGTLSRRSIRTQLEKISIIIRKDSQHELADSARRAIQEYTIQMPPISQIFEDRKVHNRRLEELERENVAGNKVGIVQEDKGEGQA